MARFMSLVALALIGCGGSGSPPLHAVTQCTPVERQPTLPSAMWQGTVFTIVMENKSSDEILGDEDAPFINDLAKQGAVAAGYRDNLSHPSEPNYVWLVAGDAFGITDDDDPVDNHIDVRSHLADQLDAQGLTWKGYFESMRHPCGLVSHYPYAAKHNPFVFFDDINGWDGTTFQPTQRCLERDVDYADLDHDLSVGALPTYAFIVPNLQNDMHDGTIAEGDAWLAREVPKILASRAFQAGGVLFLTWDEGGGSPPKDDPPMIVVGPTVKRGYVSQAAYDESSYLKTVQKILGLQPLPCNPDPSTVTTMDELFEVPLEATAP